MRSQANVVRRPAPQGSLIGGLVGLVLGVGVLAAVIAWKITKWMFQPLPLTTPKKAMRQTETDEKPVVEAAPVAPVALAHEVATRMTCRSIKGRAKLHCRLYQARGQIECKVYSMSDRARAVFGRSQVIKVFGTDDCSLEQAADIALESVKQLLKQDSRAPAPPQARRSEKNQEGPEEQRGKQALSESGQAKVLAQNDRKISSSDREVARYQGVLLEAGKKRRRKGGYESFCVSLDDESLGSIQELWGTDLERALEDSGAEVGDRIELALVGESPTLVRGKTVQKKIWNAIKL